MTEEQQASLVSLLRAIADGELAGETARCALCQMGNFDPYVAFRQLQGCCWPQQQEGCISASGLHAWLLAQSHSAPFMPVHDVATLLAPYANSYGELRYDGFLRMTLPRDPARIQLTETTLLRSPGTATTAAQRGCGASMPSEVSKGLCQLIEAERERCGHMSFHQRHLSDLRVQKEQVLRFLDAEQGVCAGMGDFISPRSLQSVLIEKVRALDQRQCQALLWRINPSGACLITFGALARHLSPDEWSFTKHAYSGCKNETTVTSSCVGGVAQQSRPCSAPRAGNTNGSSTSETVVRNTPCGSCRSAPRASRSARSCRGLHASRGARGASGGPRGVSCGPRNNACAARNVSVARRSGGDRRPAAGTNGSRIPRRNPGECRNGCGKSGSVRNNRSRGTAAQLRSSSGPSVTPLQEPNGPLQPDVERPRSRTCSAPPGCWTPQPPRVRGSGTGKGNGRHRPFTHSPLPARAHSTPRVSQPKEKAAKVALGCVNSISSTCGGVGSLPTSSFSYKGPSGANEDQATHQHEEAQEGTAAEASSTGGPAGTGESADLTRCLCNSLTTCVSLAARARSICVATDTTLGSTAQPPACNRYCVVGARRPRRGQRSSPGAGRGCSYGSEAAPKHGAATPRQAFRV